MSRRYVPGRGRGATGFIGGVSRDEVGSFQLEVFAQGGHRWADRYKWGEITPSFKYP